MYKVADLKKAVDTLVSNNVLEVDIIPHTTLYNGQPIAFTISSLIENDDAIDTVRVRMSRPKHTCENDEKFLERLATGGAVVTYQEKL